MASHHGDKNADELKTHFKKVISWVENTFPEYRKEMKGVSWGELYSQYGKTKPDPNKLEKEISFLMQMRMLAIAEAFMLMSLVAKRSFLTFAVSKIIQKEKPTNSKKESALSVIKNSR